MAKFWTETHASSVEDKWTTPRDFFQRYNDIFDFKLDAAALSNSTLVPGNWYGPDHPDEERRDAFKRNWGSDSGGGAVWLNPPYGRTISNWVHKADVESKSGVTIVCLVPSRTDTGWWHNSCIHHEIIFVRGRLKFGSHPSPAPFPSALVIMHS